MMLIQSYALVGHKEPMIQMRGVKYTTEEPLNFVTAERIDVVAGTDNYRLVMKVISMDKGAWASCDEHTAFLVDEKCWGLMKVAARIAPAGQKDMKRMMTSDRYEIERLLEAHLLL